MLIIALVLAVIGLVSLVTAVVTSNEFVAWVCIGASAVGVILLIVDAIREHQHDADPVDAADAGGEADEAGSDIPAAVDPAIDYPDDDPAEADEPAADADATEVADSLQVDDEEAESGDAESGATESAADESEPDAADVEAANADSNQPEQEPEASIDQATARWLSSS